MHLEIVQKKKKLIPLLHSIALLDAYCSIARLYKEHQNKATSFSFAEIIDSETPFLRYEDGWLPLLSLDDAISNNLLLGSNAPGKIIITGPNGAGKSTILKTMGIAAVLAQSWCIVPAKRAEQSLFSSIKTSLATGEDLSKKLSTGMAEVKIMAELLDDIRDADAHEYILVLIDEPYKGMVEAEKEVIARTCDAARILYHWPLRSTEFELLDQKLLLPIQKNKNGLDYNFMIGKESVVKELSIESTLRKAFVLV